MKTDGLVTRTMVEVTVIVVESLMKAMVVVWVAVFPEAWFGGRMLSLKAVAEPEVRIVKFDVVMIALTAMAEPEEK